MEDKKLNLDLDFLNEKGSVKEKKIVQKSRPTSFTATNDDNLLPIPFAIIIAAIIIAVAIIITTSK